MKYASIAATAVLIAASTAAFAQTPPAASDLPNGKVSLVATPPAATATTPADRAGLRQQLTSNLAKAGYTDVKIVPEGFIIQAKNKSGAPVTMFLSPDSMTVFTARDANGADATAADPSGAPPSK
jgi:hypothetical protein